MDRLFLIDGHALMFRMYYAFLRRPMINTKGTDVSVMFGFMKYLLELIRRENPTHLGVAFDPPCPTFRHEKFPEYKGNRDATPEVIKASLDPLVEMVRALGLPVLMVPGFEADDVIGTIASRAGAEGFRVYMVTPDKDFGQLITSNILQYKPGKSGSENEILGKKEVCEKYGISAPGQVIDILAIWGDAADNVPGVRGVGEKGASRLVSQFGSVEGIMEHLDQLSPKQAEAFREGAEQLALSKYLVTIRTDVPMECCKEEFEILRRKEPAQGGGRTIAELFAEYEFNSLKGLLPEAILSSETAEVRENTVPVFTECGVAEVVEAAGKERVAGISRASSGAWCISAGECVAVAEDISGIRALLEDGTVAKAGYDLKGLAGEARLHGISLNGYLADIEIMHYLINPEQSHKIEVLVRSFLNVEPEKMGGGEIPAQETLFTEPDLFSTVQEQPSVQVSVQEKTLTSLLPGLYRAVWGKLSEDPRQVRLYEDMEMPLIRVLSDIEQEGFRLDTSRLAAFGDELRGQISAKEAEIREMAGEPTLNILSPQKLGLVLFDKMKLDPKAKKNSKGSYSTDEETLTALSDRHPIVNAILEYREMRKMLSTYVEPLPGLLSPRDGKIHTTFNQALTATGRLSSMKPNLQNIPVRSQMGREIRKAFIPSSEGNVLVSADYSQIELRLMAALSGDPGLTEAFREGKDIHTATAAKIFRVDETEVTREQRSRAKTANFGIIYGISAFGLSQRLGISRTESKELIEEYFNQYPGVLSYIEGMKKKAGENGYVETLFHRKRYLPDINSRNQVVRGLAERNAVNAPIQGTAADIIKVAMIRVAERLRREGMASRMILQVHDELIFDVPAGEVEKMREIAREEMEGVLDVGFPLTVECGVGTNWLEAH